jgi:hypothetical protein
LHHQVSPLGQAEIECYNLLIESYSGGNMTEDKEAKFNVELKNGKTVEVGIDELKDYLDSNREQVEVQSKKMGKRRSEITFSTNSK